MVTPSALFPPLWCQQPHLGGTAQRGRLDGQVNQVRANLLLGDDLGAIAVLSWDQAMSSGSVRREGTCRDGKHGQ